MILGLDHVVRVFRDLDAALARPDSPWRGFNVIRGGEHADGITHNALIVGEDGVYIELVGFRDHPGRQSHRWWPLASDEGPTVDFAVVSDDLDADIAALGDLVARGPERGGRTRPDGVRVEWRTALLAPPLPFLIQDVTPRELRVPGGDATKHANGFMKTLGVVITTPDADDAERKYARLRERGDVPVSIRRGPAFAITTSSAYREVS